MSATGTVTPKQFYDLLCDDPTQAIQFFQNIPADQRHQFVSYRDQDGRTPIYVASRDGHHQVVQTLLESGAHKNATNKNRTTPIYIAAQNGHDEVVKVLLA